MVTFNNIAEYNVSMVMMMVSRIMTKVVHGQEPLARRKNQMMLFYDPLATIGGWQTGSVIADNLWSKIAESQTLLMVNYRWKVEMQLLLRCEC